MKIIAARDYADMSRKAANLISAQVIQDESCVLGLATGSTPVGVYKQLIEWYNKGDLDFSKVKSINLDEYYGLSPENDQSYRYFMNTNLFDHINIDKTNTNVPNGMTDDVDAECKRYDALISDMGGIDLQILGLGHDGHIGFNEPDETFEKSTHCVELEEITIQANARFFKSIEDVPRKAITMGIQAIMQARKVLLVASGESKAEILCRSLFGPITPAVPASILQLHPQLVVVADREALSVIAKEHPEAL